LKKELSPPVRVTFWLLFTNITNVLVLAWLEITTGEFRLTELATLTELIDELAKIVPKELLLSEKQQGQPWQQELLSEFPGVHLTWKKDTPPSPLTWPGNGYADISPP